MSKGVKFEMRDLSKVSKEYSLWGGNFRQVERPVMEAYVEELFFEDLGSKTLDKGKFKVDYHLSH